MFKTSKDRYIEILEDALEMSNQQFDELIALYDKEHEIRMTLENAVENAIQKLSTVKVETK